MTIKRKILLIRHAETDLAGTFCGHTDPSVNLRGQEQIKELVTELQNQKHDLGVVYSSDLQRAYSTASEISRAFGAPMHTSPNLREIGFGDWEGFTWEQNERRDPAYASRWIAEYPNLSTPNGEEFEAFKVRILHEFDALVTVDQNAAVVTHAGVLRVILTHRCGLTDEQARELTKNYCSVYLREGA